MFTLTNPQAYLPIYIWIIGTVFTAFTLIFSIRAAQIHQAFKEPFRIHLWLYISFSLCTLWLIKAQIMNHLYIHLVGANLALLVLGAPLALLALAVSTALSSFSLHSSPLVWGSQFLLAGALPIFISMGLNYLAQVMLPRRLFVFIFIQGFGISTLSMSLTMFINLTILNQLQLISLVGNDIFWMSPILLGWGEGFLTGTVIAMVATYRPDWLYKNTQFKGF